MSILKKIRVILYTRVSTTDQKDNGYSLPDQLERLLLYCKIKGYEVVMHFEDDASAKTFNRPKFKEMKAYCQKHKKEIDLVLFIKWDRFARNIELSYPMIGEFREMGIGMNASEQPVDFSIPENKLLLALYLATPDVENERRGLNTKNGIRQARLLGYPTGTPPYGYKRAFLNGKPIFEANDKASLVLDAFQEVAKALVPVDHVRQALKAKGFEKSQNQFYIMLTNPLYMGYIFVKGNEHDPDRLVKGNFEGIVPVELFERVSNLLSKARGEREIPERGNHDLAFPLKGALVCSDCRRSMTIEVIKNGKGGKFPYYKCYNKKCTGEHKRLRAKDTNKTFLLFLDQFKVNSAGSELFKLMLNNLFSRKEMDASKLRDSYDKKVLDIDELRGRAVEKFLNGDLQKCDYERVVSNSEKSLREALADLERQEAALKGVDKQIEFGLSLMSEPSKFFDACSLEVKSKLMGLMFPEKVTSDGKTFQTQKINPALRLIMLITSKLGHKKDRAEALELASTLSREDNGVRTHDLWYHKPAL